MTNRITIARSLTLAAVTTLALTAAPLSAATLSLTDLGTGNQNLTTFGGGDWAIYSTTDLVSSETKVGGSGLGALTYTDADNVLTAANSSTNVLLSWTDGTPTPSATNADRDQLISTAVDETAEFSTSVVASTATNSLYVVYGQWNATSRLTASLSDGSIADQTIDFTSNDFQTVRIDFASNGPATLNVTIEYLDGTTTNTNGSIRFQALALASVPVPAPAGLPAGLALLGLAAARRRLK